MKIQIFSLYSHVLFEYEADKNSVKITLAVGVSRDADLRDANLRNADLRNADLRNANLRDADLRDADLRDANLRNADLRNANLRNANLRNADLRDANLLNANLCDAQLGDEKRFAQFSCIPKEGAFIGWKKLKNNVIAKLLIPAEAKRTFSLVGRKNRAEYVEVIDILGAEIGISIYDNITEYEKGATVKSDSYNPDIRIECTHGIHFFITRKEAEDYLI